MSEEKQEQPDSTQEQKDTDVKMEEENKTEVPEEKKEEQQDEDDEYSVDAILGTDKDDDTEEESSSEQAAMPKIEKQETAEEPDIEEKEVTEPVKEKTPESVIFALRTTANREDQVMDFLSSNITKKGLAVYSIIRPHGMRGYIFLEAAAKLDAEQAAHGIPYARGILPKAIDYKEMEHMVEPVKRELTIKKNDIVEIISGPFKRETAKITRIDETKEEVVVELVEAAVPIPITLKIDAVKVIRRDSEDVEN